MTVSGLAARHGVPLAGLVPAGIDGGLVAVVVLDLVLPWLGAPVVWLRQLTRVLSVGTIVTNVVAGWPDLVATVLHAAAPVMLLAMIEAGRAVMLRSIGEARGTLREVIPLVRWLLAPWRTFLLWRRMALWQITSYRAALDAELEVRRAVTLLRARCGRRWRHNAPVDVVWMLRTGVNVDVACAQVGVLMGVDESDSAMSSPRSTAHSGTGAAGEARVPAGTSDLLPMPGEKYEVRSEDTEVHVDRLADAVRLNRQHWIEVGRSVPAETLRQKLRVSTGTSRELTRAVRAADRAAVIAAGVPS